jgi:hypothetical protein
MPLRGHMGAELGLVCSQTMGVQIFSMLCFLWIINPKIFAYFSYQNIIDFRMARDRGTLIEGNIMPPRMAGAFSDKFAALLPKKFQESCPFYTAIFSSW